MLGFILSKMQMLVFAVGIAIVALLFYDFVSRIGLAESANTLLISNSKIVSDQMNNDLLCSDKFTTLPNVLTYGFSNEAFPYELEFSKQSFGSGDTIENLLILRIVEHKSASTKKNIVAAKSVSSDAEFILVDTDFISETSPLEKSYNDGKNTEISLYPRAASKGVQASSPNAFVALKEVKDGKKTIYIIPCATEKEPNNCVRNILRVGCLLLKLDGKTNSDDLVPSCFNKSTQASASYEKSRNYTWADCKSLFSEVTDP
ncbi:MAG: hypothetical protein WC462_05215 [archaeon]